MATQKNLSSRKGAIFILGVVIILAIVALFLIHKSDTQKTNSGNYITGATYPDAYDVDTCNCVERNRPTCLEGFYYNETRGFCVNPTEKKVTYPRLGCSLYECSDANYKFDLDNKEWLEVTG